MCKWEGTGLGEGRLTFLSRPLKSFHSDFFPLAPKIPLCWRFSFLSMLRPKIQVAHGAKPDYGYKRDLKFEKRCKKPWHWESQARLEEGSVARWIFELLFPGCVFLVLLVGCTDTSRVSPSGAPSYGHPVWFLQSVMHWGARKELCAPGVGGARRAQTAFLSLLAGTKGFALLSSLW